MIWGYEYHYFRKHPYEVHAIEWHTKILWNRRVIIVQTIHRYETNLAKLPCTSHCYPAKVGNLMISKCPYPPPQSGMLFNDPCKIREPPTTTATLIPFPLNRRASCMTCGGSRRDKEDKSKAKCTWIMFKTHIWKNGVCLQQYETWNQFFVLFFSKKAWAFALLMRTLVSQQLLKEILRRVSLGKRRCHETAAKVDLVVAPVMSIQKSDGWCSRFFRWNFATLGGGFSPTHLKIIKVKLDHFPKVSGWKFKKYLKSFLTPEWIHQRATHHLCWWIALSL